jgi:hypothetical protein
MQYNNMEKKNYIHTTTEDILFNGSTALVGLGRFISVS